MASHLYVQKHKCLQSEVKIYFKDVLAKDIK